MRWNLAWVQPSCHRLIRQCVSSHVQTTVRATESHASLNLNGLQNQILSGILNVHWKVVARVVACGQDRALPFTPRAIYLIGLAVKWITEPSLTNYAISTIWFGAAAHSVTKLGWTAEKSFCFQTNFLHRRTLPRLGNANQQISTVCAAQRPRQSNVIWIKFRFNFYTVSFYPTTGRF